LLLAVAQHAAVMTAALAIPAELADEEDCLREWEDAYEQCAEELAKPAGGRNRGVTGGYSDLEKCARGLVSERCGGNPVDWGR